jgi:hypothetical protein
VAPRRLSARALGRATLARQMLLRREEVPVAEAVGRLGALQAQEPRPPVLALWSRVDGLAAEAVTRALEERDVVRATAMRATLHLMTGEDYLATRGALAEALAGATRVLRGERSENLDVDATLDAARELLTGGPLTFAEIRDALAERFPGAHPRGLGYTVRMRLPLVMVPTEDRWGFPSAARFGLADEWLGEPVPDAAAPEELVRLHLRAFGPATAADVASWTGIGGVAATLAGMADELVPLRDEAGRELWDLPDGPRPGDDVEAPPRLLPEFDSLLLAHADRSRLIDDAHRARVVTPNLRVRATFLWDGRVAGTWSVERAKGVARLTLTPFARLPKGASAALRDEAAGMVRFAEPQAKDHDVSVGRVSGS